ncbi:MAG: zf-TFIIB domain-containing protein [Acidobacteria bacterium]|nr:zf-TFIIB domain-containing protein [Acidobacteriota bacterium]
MSCPGCGAAMRLDERRACLVCDFCGQIHFPDSDAEGVQVLHEVSELGCPVCRERLMHAAVAGQRLFYCLTCRGLLIAMPVFAGLVRELRLRRGDQEGILQQPFEPHDPGRGLLCPKCGREMDSHPYYGSGGVVIDNCPECYWNWLDHGELRRIVSTGPKPEEPPPVAGSGEEDCTEEVGGSLSRLLGITPIGRWFSQR